MHKSAMARMKWFIDNYIDKDKEVSILDIGSYDVNGCYKTLFKNTKVKYTGLDLSKGPNVDIVPKDPYLWKEIDDNTYDFIISGNAFEHIEYPWLTIKEIYRVLKQDGFACILAPFAIGEHRYPTDCYRYYSDGFKALAKWGGFKIIEVTVGGMVNSDISYNQENYDDTMMVISKTDKPDIELQKLPKIKIENRIHNWN